MSPLPPTDFARWRRVEAILDVALDLSPEERSALLDQSCAGDPELRAEVEALLAADAKAGGFLGVPAGEYAADLLTEGSGEEEDAADLAGSQVGPYRLLREIGGGGMGTVYEAEDTRLGRRVAVKVLPPEYNRDRRAKERFLREARAASAVDHPNLCTVHDVGESGGRLYIVLTLYEGETLRERIRRGPLPPGEAREVAIQVARGLARAHEAGITHRDIKPANVMLTRRGEVKILDFGIARLEGDEVSLTRTGASWGTPAYMSPEQARGEPVDCRTDVWSLGVLLYEMLAGRRPFRGESLEAVLSSILTQEPEPLERIRPDVPPELVRVVDRALVKDRTERYANATELLAGLESGRPSGFLPALFRGRPKKAFQRSLVAGSLALLLLLACALAWRLWRPAPPSLRLAVLYPKITVAGNNSELSFVASEVLEATLATLTSLEGLHPLDPPEKDEGSGSEAERLRSLEADEALLPLLNCQGDWCRATFRRLSKRGEVLGTVGPFEIPIGIENAYQLADGVRSNLQQIYSNRRLQPGSAGDSVRPEDYSAYIKLERLYTTRLGNKELAQLDRLLQTSPDLLGAYLLAASILRNQRDIDRALSYVTRAEKIAPYAPGPLFTRLQIELEGKRLGPAGTTLARLEKLAPNDARVQSARAELLEAKGALEEAYPLRKEAARRRPTWARVLELATLEFRLGMSDTARQRLRELFAVQPNNQWILEHLAALEAVYGDPKRAAELYEEVIRIRPARPLFTSLGFVRFLTGDYAAAIAADRQAIAMEPGYLLTRFNLSEALEAQGNLTESRRICSALVQEIATLPAPPDTSTRLRHAQCLVRLGNRAEAERIAGEALKTRPEDIQDLHEAAQLYAVLGDRISARFYTKLALEKGLGREWFLIPAFRSLEKDPELRALLGSPGPHKSS
jgi:serine/threonine protein kinase/tetratricopeptide (TPR) repeat protein